MGGYQFAGSASEYAAKIALLEISIAAPIIMTDPQVWKIAQIIYASQCDPEGVVALGNAWNDFADHLSSAQKDIAAVLSGLDETDWNTDDRKGFEEHMHKVSGALNAIEVVARVASAAMRILGVLLGIMVWSMSAIATTLFIMAPLTKIPFTAAFANAAVKMTSMYGHMALKALDTAISTVGNVWAGVLGGAMVVDIGIQLGNGNTDVFADLGAGIVDSLDDIVKGLVAFGEVAAFGKFIKKGGPLGAGLTGLNGLLGVLPKPDGDGGYEGIGQVTATIGDQIPNHDGNSFGYNNDEYGKDGW